MEKQSRLKNYEKLMKLGEGTYGNTYKARDRITGNYVAVKRIRCELLADGVLSHIREAELLKELSHPNIVKILEIVQSTEKFNIVMEFVDYEIKKIMDASYAPLDDQTIKSVLYQLLNGIAYCHENKIMHGNLNFNSLLIDKNSVLKIIDFGIMRDYEVTFNQLWYSSPEILMRSAKNTSAIDMWSIGCIFSELVTKKVLFPGHHFESQLEKIFKIRGTPTIEEWPSIKDLPGYNAELVVFPPRQLSKFVPSLDSLGLDLLEKLLQINPLKRITAKDALLHPYFSDVAEAIKKLK